MWLKCTEWEEGERKEGRKEGRERKREWREGEEREGGRNFQKREVFTLKVAR